MLGWACWPARDTLQFSLFSLTLALFPSPLEKLLPHNTSHVQVLKRLWEKNEGEMLFSMLPLIWEEKTLTFP